MPEPFSGLPGTGPGNDRTMLPSSSRTRETAPSAPNGPQHAKQKRSGGPSPLVVAGAAFGLGTLLAKLIDWRGHAHPRR